ncbi:GNAT family N-acetyltransferase [Pedobacter sp. JCM 36344]|uniref:GNAT family N-acetyltransferase n=1 Tax=Pedobacter sp. JCM 36344 TaxID=3374280 RepID=UPI00397C4203
MNMMKVGHDKKELVVSILVDSFESNLSVNYIAGASNEKSKRIKALMEYSFEICRLFGDVYISDDGFGCALVLYPDKRKTTVKSIMLDIFLLFKCIGITNIGKAISREQNIKKIQPKEPMTYLWFLGVNPSSQNLGIGSKLLQEVILDSEEKNLPVYLETSTVNNLSWYKQFSFQIYDQLEFTYSLYFLKRNVLK